MGERRGAVVVALIACAAACGGEERRGAPADDGGTASGGSARSSGGRQSAGGRESSGGRTAAGGAPSGTGGVTGEGGAASSGGQPSTGGATQSCNSDSECLGGEFCIGTSETTVCVQGNCKLDAECAEGEQCYRARCTPLRGAAINCDWEARCRPDLVCTLGVCTLPLPPHTRCDVACEGERICMTDGEGRPFCEEDIIVCPNDEVCSYADYCGAAPVDGGPSCRPRLAVNEPCKADRECGIGLACMAERCTRRGAGASCVHDAECPEDNYCFKAEDTEPATCVARILPYELCGIGAGGQSRTSCVRGFLCSDTTSRCEPLEALPCLVACPAGQRCEKKIENGKCSLLPT